MGNTTGSSQLQLSSGKDCALLRAKSVHGCIFNRGVHRAPTVSGCYLADSPAVERDSGVDRRSDGEGGLGRVRLGVGRMVLLNASTKLLRMEIFCISG